MKMMSRTPFKPVAVRYRGFEMNLYFFGIKENRLFIMTKPERMIGVWPSLEDRSRMEAVIKRRVDWSRMSKIIDVTELFDEPIKATTFELFEPLYNDVEVDPEYTDTELIEIATSMYGGPWGIA